MHEHNEEQILFFERLNVGWVLDVDILNAMGTNNLDQEPLSDMLTDKTRAEAKWGL